jgi:hypothetical protein
MGEGDVVSMASPEREAYFIILCKEIFFDEKSRKPG